MNSARLSGGARRRANSSSFAGSPPAISNFAEADDKRLARSPELTIHPWGRIEGTVKIGSRPAAGVQGGLSEGNERWAPDEAMPITQAQQQKSDAQGHYAFERVIPAELSVSRIFTLERSNFHVGTGDSRTVVVEPHKTTWVDPGGTGRPVVGRFVLPSGIKPGAVFPYLNQTLELIRSEPPCPEGLNRQGATPGLRSGWPLTRARLIPGRSKLTTRMCATMAGSASKTFSLAFWSALNRPTRLTEAQRRLGAIMRGEV